MELLCVQRRGGQHDADHQLRRSAVPRHRRQCRLPDGKHVRRLDLPVPRGEDPRRAQGPAACGWRRRLFRLQQLVGRRPARISLAGRPESRSQPRRLHPQHALSQRLRSDRLARNQPAECRPAAIFRRPRRRWRLWRCPQCIAARQLHPYRERRTASHQCRVAQRLAVDGSKRRQKLRQRHRGHHPRLPDRHQRLSGDQQGARLSTGRRRRSYILSRGQRRRRQQPGLGLQPVE